MFLGDEVIHMVYLVKENRERIANSRALIVELAQTIEECRAAAQARHDALNPKIILGHSRCPAP